MKPWDPLEFNLSAEIVGATIKRQIKNILKSYTGWYDPFSEMIQNALDALDKRLEHEAGFKPRLFVTIDLKENVISVTDNGVGFTETQLQSFLAPNVSYKTQANRGNKGVGATYLGYGFNSLQVGTKSPGFSYLGSLKDGRKWVEDEAGVIPRPVVAPDQAPLDSSFNSIDQGTTFALKLVGDFIRPRDLNWTGATTAGQWGAILRLKTPLGGVYLGESPPSVHCTLRVIDQQGGATSVEISPCEYLYPNTVISAAQSLTAIRAKQMDLIKQGKDATKIPDHMMNLNGLFNVWRPDDLLSEEGEFKKTFTQDEKTQIRAYKIGVYGFMCYSTDVWDTYNDDVLKLRRGGRILRGGLQLATNGMPQGEQIVIPLKRNIGYQNVSHVVVQLRGADPDLGRKGFQPELQKLCEKISVAVVEIFLEWRRHLKKDSGAAPDIVAQRTIHEWLIAQEKHEKEAPLLINRKDLFLPMREPAITSAPLNEQDVIALFNQLLAGGVIRGIKLLATSQHNQYDGVFRFVIKPPLENHVFEQTHNPLGIDKNQAKVVESAPLVLEYKYKLDALIEDFEKGDKSEKDIRLVVVWEIGGNWKTRYSITPLLHLENVHHRQFHGCTHIVRSSMTGEQVFQLVCLKELVDYINDPDKVQDYQRQAYIES